jgi:phospholysine phosphohistidine inorganic pyrophosphate phosphatase
MGLAAKIGGFLIDLDGTVTEANSLIPGVPETLAWLREKGLPYRFVTNTTSKPREVIIDKLGKLGLTVAPEELFTAPIVGRDYLRSHGLTRCYAVIRSSLEVDLEGVDLVEESPDAVLVGDIGDELTYDKLNRAFRFLLDGAAFIALAQNRYFRGEDGLCLDVGSIVAALEYASQRKSVLVGKPAAEFFATAGKSLGVPADSIAVIGDDLEADALGGKNAGGIGLLVRTGKFRQEQLDGAPTPPDAVLASLAALPKWMADEGCNK